MMSLVHDNEMRMEGHQEGRKEGRHEGEEIKLIELVLKKINKGMPAGEIAEFLEEPPERIQYIADIAQRIGNQEPLAVYEEMNTRG